MAQAYLPAPSDRIRRVVNVHLSTQLLPLLQLAHIGITSVCCSEPGFLTLNPVLAFELAVPVMLLGQAVEVALYANGGVVCEFVEL